MENKYIHYFWFGDKPLSKIAKKCIRTWKKVFPDYEIIKWNESNFNVNECPFIKDAYKSKKWAFVADYARTKVLNEMGGLYLDTDMLVKDGLKDLLGDKTVLGIEDSRMVNAAIWYEPNPKSYISSKLLEFYQSQDTFYENDMFSFSIPRLITKILLSIGLDPTIDTIQELKNNIVIYPREYFYPLSYNYRNNVFSDNTVAIHYFDATWVPKWEQRENRIIRKLGEKNGLRFIKICRFSKKVVKRCLKTCLFPLVLKRRYDRSHPKKYIKKIDNALIQIPNKKDYIVFSNSEWFGVYNATLELFHDHTIDLGELNSKKYIKKIASEILKNKSIKQVVFSAMCIGWKDLILCLKTKDCNIKIKTFWHGNHSQVSEPYGWARNEEIFDLHKTGYIDLMGTCKKSLIEFYKSQGYNAIFMTNIINDNIKKLKAEKYNDGKLHIGLYAAKSDDWRKNMYSQIAAVSYIKNAVIDMVPLNDDAIKFANSLHIPIYGEKTSLPREELIKRMSRNDINLYVTFSECAPMVILESFAVDVPCISGNNHHYFENSKLKDYLIVNNESSPKDISEKITLCLNNYKEILNEYKKWEKLNLNENKEQLNDFLER